jgi:hypothetical protein
MLLMMPAILVARSVSPRTALLGVPTAAILQVVVQELLDERTRRD